MVDFSKRLKSDLKFLGPPLKERFKDGAVDGREYDRTQLKLAQFQYQPHKDYLGHVFRWGFVGKFVNRSSRILDAGCGQELPLLRSLGGSNPATLILSTGTVGPANVTVLFQGILQQNSTFQVVLGSMTVGPGTASSALLATTKVIQSSRGIGLEHPPAVGHRRVDGDHRDGAVVARKAEHQYL